MKHLRRIFVKFYLHFANSKVEAELAREIGAHLALLEDEYLRQGMTPEDARRAARLACGGVEQAKQLHRDERAFQGLGQILQDNTINVTSPKIAISLIDFIQLLEFLGKSRMKSWTAQPSSS
jgi:hypothetical protein